MAIFGPKSTSLKSRKIEIFPKGLTHAFGPKMAIFPTVFLSNIGQKKCVLRCSRTKKRLSSYKNIKFKKSKN